jgi:hypothetical protein
MTLYSRPGQILLRAAMAGVIGPGCYSAGGGTAPPAATLYFPVALSVSEDGNVLYAVNSDFDLQYNGGTLQSYDLYRLRRDATALIEANTTSGSAPPANIPFVSGSQWQPNCIMSPPAAGMPLGESCSPPVRSTDYEQATVVIGAFASGLQTSNAVLPDGRRRLFVPVRGDVTVTWADVGPTSDPNPAVRFRIDCGKDSQNRCDATHRAGNDPNQPGNTRNVVMPGEPFGIAQTEDGTAIAITHQTDTKMSLLKSGLSSSLNANPSSVDPPTMEFVLDGLPSGGVGVAAVPHDPDAPQKRCEDPMVMDAPPCVRPAFLETSRSNAEIDLIRYYDDDGSSLNRPFLNREAAYPITSNAVGTDSRGIVIDATLRMACKAAGGDPATCAQLPARVFFASRTPPALGLGLIGATPPLNSGPYDPDQFMLTGNVPLPNGPSNVYLAPIVDPSGNFALRVFVVCFDSSQVVVYDPDAPGIVSVINVGPGPFAMTFDPFSIQDVATHSPAPLADQNGVKPYRFAYVASFTESFVQMIDLDNSQPTSETFERVVFTLGQPTLPKGQ